MVKEAGSQPPRSNPCLILPLVTNGLIRITKVNNMIWILIVSLSGRCDNICSVRSHRSHPYRFQSICSPVAVWNYAFSPRVLSRCYCIVHTSEYSNIAKHWLHKNGHTRMWQPGWGYWSSCPSFHVLNSSSLQNIFMVVVVLILCKYVHTLKFLRFPLIQFTLYTEKLYRALK